MRGITRFRLNGGTHDGREDFLRQKIPPDTIWNNFIGKGTIHQQYRLAGTIECSDGTKIWSYEFTGVSQGS